MTAPAFAQNLLAFIEANGTDKAEVARRLGVSPSTLTRWTQAPRKLRAQDLLALARVLGVDPYVLMGSTFVEPSPKKERPRRGRPPSLRAVEVDAAIQRREHEREDVPSLPTTTPRLLPKKN